MTEIFISYKTEDRKRVEHLVAALRGAGLDTWWDQDIPPGGWWRETITAHLNSAALCIVAWSRESTGTGGRFVQEEAEHAVQRGTYLGVLIDSVTLPLGFAAWQSIDLSKWNGRRSDPALGRFIAQVRARLEHKEVEPPPPPPWRRRLPTKALAIGGAVLLLAAAGLLIYWLRPAPVAPMTPTAFVNARLDAIGCSWLQIANVAPAEGGERIALTGIARAADEVQVSIMREALAASVPIAEISVDDVAVGPPETCAELNLLRQHPWRGRPRLAVTQPRGALQRTPDGWEIGLEYEIDFRSLPPDAALLGLDSIGGVRILIPDLHAFRRTNAPRSTRGGRATYYTIMSDDNQGARNVGLILMTASGQIDERLVRGIGTQTDRVFMSQFAREAQARRWQFELALIPCGFEGSITRRQC